MRLLALLLGFVLALAPTPVAPDSIAVLVAHRPITFAATTYERIHAATFQIKMGRYSCSATAIGRHRLLTAGHCFDQPPTALLINGEACEVYGFMRDGHDHVILGTDKHCSFTHWVAIGKPAKQGDVVFIYGSPMGLTDQLRFGRMSGYGYVPDDYKDEAPGFDGQFELFDLNSAPGDSGSGIFNTKGELVAVLSIGTIVFTDPLQLTGALPLAFTKAQRREAGI